jgi:hypothetical protein
VRDLAPGSGDVLGLSNNIQGQAFDSTGLLPALHELDGGLPIRQVKRKTDVSAAYRSLNVDRAPLLTLTAVARVVIG